jgi:hypothetical protein
MSAESSLLEKLMGAIRPTAEGFACDPERLAVVRAELMAVTDGALLYRHVGTLVRFSGALEQQGELRAAKEICHFSAPIVARLSELAHRDVARRHAGEAAARAQRLGSSRPLGLAAPARGVGVRRPA